MKLSLVERETILLYNQAEPMAEVYTHDPRLMEKLELLAKKHPDQITRKDAHNFTVPKRCVSVREASYEEYKANLRRNAKNFRITDEHLGEGGPKAKFQANVNAIRLLKELEAAGQQASPEQQEVLSRYVGWGGLSDAFDPEKPVWALEYAQLKELLTPEEYALNSHPAVLDGFIDLVREEQQRSRTQREKLEPSRPSVRDKLKQELPAHKSASPKKREPER